MENKKKELRLGVIIFLVLAVFTAVEYLVGIMLLPVALLWIIALCKAGLVIWYFMHIRRIFRSQGGH